MPSRSVGGRCRHLDQESTCRLPESVPPSSAWKPAGPTRGPTAARPSCVRVRRRFGGAGAGGRDETRRHRPTPRPGADVSPPRVGPVFVCVEAAGTDSRTCRHVSSLGSSAVVSFRFAGVGRSGPGRRCRGVVWVVLVAGLAVGGRCRPLDIIEYYREGKTEALVLVSFPIPIIPIMSPLPLIPWPRTLTEEKGKRSGSAIVLLWPARPDSAPAAQDTKNLASSRSSDFPIFRGRRAGTMPRRHRPVRCWHLLSSPERSGQ